MIRLFRVFIPASVLALLLSEIVLILACYLVAIFLLRIDAGFYLFGDGNYWKLLVVTGFIILGLYYQDLYAELRITSRMLLIQQVCLAVGSALLLLAFLGFLQPEFLMSRWLMVLGSFLVVLVLPVYRVFFWRYIIGALRSERVLLLGNSSILAEVIECLQDKPQFGYSILGYLYEDAPNDFPVPCLGQLNDVREICEKHKPTRIVVGMAERRNRLPMHDLLEIRFSGIVIEDAADTYEVAMRRVCSRKIQPSQLIFSRMLGPNISRAHAPEYLFVSDGHSGHDCFFAPDACDGPCCQAYFEGAGLLPAASGGRQRPHLHLVQVPFHVRGC